MGNGELNLNFFIAEILEQSC